MPDSLEGLIDDVKAAVLETQRVLDERQITIASVELELKVTSTKNLGSGVAFKIEPIGIEFGSDGKITDEFVSLIKITLKPPQTELELLSSPKDDLVSAIKTICQVVDSAIQSTPVFLLSESTIELNFGLKKEGTAKFSIVFKAEGGASHLTNHVLRLKLAGPGEPPKSEDK